MDDLPIDSIEEFERALADANNTKKVLRLYVAGNSRKSAQVIAKIHEFCESHFKGLYELKVIDICQQPELARSEQIIAVPTLIKLLPLPLRRLIGDFTRTEHILVGLDLCPMESASHHGDVPLDEAPEKAEGDDQG